MSLQTLDKKYGTPSTFIAFVLHVESFVGSEKRPTGPSETLFNPDIIRVKYSLIVLVREGVNRTMSVF